MFRLELAVYEPKPVDDPTMWRVAFNVIHDDGTIQYTPTTIFKNKLQSTRKADVLVAACMEVIPGQLHIAFGLEDDRKPQSEDYFDALAKTLEEQKNDE